MARTSLKKSSLKTFPQDILFSRSFGQKNSGLFHNLKRIMQKEDNTNIQVLSFKGFCSSVFNSLNFEISCRKSTEFFLSGFQSLILILSLNMRQGLFCVLSFGYTEIIGHSLRTADLSIPIILYSYLYIIEGKIDSPF